MCQVNEMSSWWNVKLMKCQADNMFMLMKWLVDQTCQVGDIAC